MRRQGVTNLRHKEVNEWNAERSHKTEKKVNLPTCIGDGRRCHLCDYLIARPELAGRNCGKKGINGWVLTNVHSHSEKQPTAAPT